MDSYFDLGKKNFKLLNHGPSKSARAGLQIIQTLFQFQTFGPSFLVVLCKFLRHVNINSFLHWQICIQENTVNISFLGFQTRRHCEISFNKMVVQIAIWAKVSKKYILPLLWSPLTQDLALKFLIRPYVYIFHSNTLIASFPANNPSLPKKARKKTIFYGASFFTSAFQHWPRLASMRPL